MRKHRNMIAVGASVLSLAAGGGVAWACTPGDPGYPGGTTTAATTTGTTTTTDTTTTSASTTAAARRATRVKHTRKSHRIKRAKHLTRR